MDKAKLIATIMDIVSVNVELFFKSWIMVRATAPDFRWMAYLGEAQGRRPRFLDAIEPEQAVVECS